MSPANSKLIVMEHW